MYVPKFIKSNGPHLEWNRMLLSKMFTYFPYRKNEFACAALMYLPEKLWYSIGFYKSQYIQLVEDYSERKADESQQWMNLYVWRNESGEEMRNFMSKYERLGDQYFLLSMDKEEKFISGFWLCEHTESHRFFKGVIDFMNEYCNY